MTSTKEEEEEEEGEGIPQICGHTALSCANFSPRCYMNRAYCPPLAPGACNQPLREKYAPQSIKTFQTEREDVPKFRTT